MCKYSSDLSDFSRHIKGQHVAVTQESHGLVQHANSNSSLRLDLHYVQACSSPETLWSHSEESQHRGSTLQM